jgi:hypothetical protein
MKPASAKQLIDSIKGDASFFHTLVFNPQSIKEQLSELPAVLQQRLLSVNFEELLRTLIVQPPHIYLDCEVTCKVTCTATMPNRNLETIYSDRILSFNISNH